MASGIDMSTSRSVSVELLDIPGVARVVATTLPVEDGTSWMDPIASYLKDGLLDARDKVQTKNQGHPFMPY